MSELLHLPDLGGKMPESPKKPKLLDQVRDEIRVRHYSIRTEEAYLTWIKRFILFHNKRHPAEMGPDEVKAYLTYLAVDCNVAPATQNQALNALVFLYKHVLHMEVGDISSAVRAHFRQRVPTVLTEEEVSLMLNALTGEFKLIAQILYGGGLRVLECVRLRVKDLDFARNTITVRSGKGRKDRVTFLPLIAVDPLREHLEHVRLIHHDDLRAGLGEVHLPYALERKSPNAAREWIWQYVFPSKTTSIDPRSSRRGRHHLHADSVNKHIREAARITAIPKNITSHCFRHSFATHMLEAGVPIHTVQELLGHKDIETTRIYLHVMKKPGSGMISPLDRLKSPVPPADIITPAADPTPDDD